MNRFMLIMGIVAITLAGISGVTPLVLSGDVATAVDEHEDRLEDNPEEGGLEGDSYWISGHFVYVSSYEDHLNRTIGGGEYTGSTFYLALVSDDPGDDLDSCANDTNSSCFEFYSFDPLDEGRSGIFQVVNEKPTLECLYTQPLTPFIRCADFYRYWIVISPSQTTLFFVTPAVVFGILGIALSVIGLRMRY